MGGTDRRRAFGRGGPVAALAFALALALALVVLGGAGASGARAAQDGVVTLPVSFTVRNEIGASKVKCPPLGADGGSYTIRGHLVAPRSVLASGNAAVTLYYHQIGSGEFFWRFQAVPDYDYAAALARAGNASVVIDRLGFGASGHPPGKRECYGSEATVAHQIVGDLRSGRYGVGSGAPPRFARVLLAAHANSSFSTQDEAYSYHDVDGLLVLSFGDLAATPTALADTATQQAVCNTANAGQGEESGGALGYAYFGDGDGRRAVADGFYDADPRVMAATIAMRRRSPCGDTQSAVESGIKDGLNLSSVRVPVLVLGGDHDVFFAASRVALQRTLYVGNRDVTTIICPNTGNEITLGRTHDQVENSIAQWLRVHGFSGSPTVAAGQRRTCTGTIGGAGPRGGRSPTATGAGGGSSAPHGGVEAGLGGAARR